MHVAGDWRSSSKSRFGVMGASSTRSGMAAALTIELESPMRTTPSEKRGFMVVRTNAGSECRVVKTDYKKRRVE